MKLLFLDFETQSADPTTTNITEVGAQMVLLNPGEMPRVLCELSQLVYEDTYPPQSEEIADITGITDSMLKEKGLPPALAIGTDLASLIHSADYVLAHNAYGFDKIVYESTCARVGIEVVKPREGWIDTLVDVPYPKKFTCHKLSHLAFDHGVVANPEEMHRAIHDVRLLARFIYSCYPMKTILEYRAIPWVYIFLKGVKGPWQDGGETNNLAKKLGFGWQQAKGDFNGPKFEKRWVKRVKDTPANLLAEKEKCPSIFTLTKLADPSKEYS
jgi:DNA polymerase III epsilon subunit-like protein